jgi:integrase
MPEREWRWNEQTNEYVSERERRGEWSESTVAAYRGHLRAVQRLLAVSERAPTVAEVGVENVRQLQEAPLSPNYVGLLLVVLRGFLAWAGNPVAKEAHLFRIQRTDLGRRRWLSKAQAVALWNAANERERVPIGLMMWAGLRRVEVLRLRVRDADFALDNATLRVCGKGHRWREISLPPILWATLRAHTAGMKPDDHLWTGGKNAVDRTLYAAGHKAGCFPIRPNGTPNVSNHDLRRTFIRLTLETRKVDLWDVAAMVGHKSADMTVHYAGLDRTKADQAARALTEMLGLRTPEA